MNCPTFKSDLNVKNHGKIWAVTCTDIYEKVYNMLKYDDKTNIFMLK
jgi:hypothetical protein